VLPHKKKKKKKKKKEKRNQLNRANSHEKKFSTGQQIL